MKRSSLFTVLVLLVSLMAFGCDDGKKKKKPVNNNNVNLCGNGVIDEGEACDGENLGEATCETLDQGYTGGELACSATCQFDTSACTTPCTDACTEGTRVCNADLLRVCEVDTETGCTIWVNTDCTETNESCMVIADEAQCAACMDQCALNDERCNTAGTGIEVCEVSTLGCLAWQTTACPAAAPVCEIVEAVPTCVALCEDECTLGESACDEYGTGINACVTGDEGCTVWKHTACEAATPFCMVDAGSAVCIANGSGDTCDDVHYIHLPFSTSGTDFMADYPTVGLVFTDTDSCMTNNSNRNDAIFALSLTAGEVIVFEQGGGLDGMIYLLGDCDPSGVCLEAEDSALSGGVEEILFEAPVDGVYYLVVKPWSATPGTRSYFINVYHYEDTEVSCSDGFDNDLDGLVDCMDPDCAGVDPCGDENTADRCSDGIDNDADGLVDCDDPDCFGMVGACETELNCADGQDNDADGLTDCEDPDCESFITCQAGKSCEDPLHLDSFPFHVSGTDFLADFPLNQNYQNTAGGCGFAAGNDFVFSVNLNEGQRIHVLETGSLDVVLRVMTTCTHESPTCLFHQDDPDNYVFQAPADGLYYFILEAYSASPGVTVRAYDITVNLVPDTETICDDGLDNDMDGLIDCADPDCFGQTGCTVETICNDGQDNDLDGLTDCEDPDCATYSYCEESQSCQAPLHVDSFPFAISGDDFYADFTNDHTFTGGGSVGCGTANGSEAVFTVDLLAGQRLRMDEPGSLDVVFRVLGTCTTSPYTCLLSQDSPETNVQFVAPVDGTYFIVLEAYYSSHTSRAYDFTMHRFDVTETSCDDGIDNDGDGLTDCADPDCYGVGTCPVPLLEEGFGTWPPEGWTIVDGGTTTHTWMSSASGTARTLTGASGLFAKVDSDAAGSGNTLEEELISPSFDCTGLASVTLTFRHYYFHSTSSRGFVDITTDDGITWENVITYSASTANGAVANLDLSPWAAGEPDVRIRLRYIDGGTWAWYWLIDDFVVLGL